MGIVTSAGFRNVSGIDWPTDYLDPQSHLAHLLCGALLDDEPELEVAGAQASGGHLAHLLNASAGIGGISGTGSSAARRPACRICRRASTGSVPEGTMVT